jgi:hypothetical protein
MREAERLSPREQEKRAEALAKRGRQIQEEWNRRRQMLAPGTDPKTRGISEADKAEARRNIANRQAQRDAYLERLRQDEQARQVIAAKEAAIKQKVAQYEAGLREKAGLPQR